MPADRNNSVVSSSLPTTTSSSSSGDKFSKPASAACLGCRAIKAKCKSAEGSSDDPRCQRCQRLNIVCEFVESARGKNNHKNLHALAAKTAAQQAEIEALKLKLTQANNSLAVVGSAISGGSSDELVQYGASSGVLSRLQSEQDLSGWYGDVALPPNAVVQHVASVSALVGHISSAVTSSAHSDLPSTFLAPSPLVTSRHLLLSPLRRSSSSAQSPVSSADSPFDTTEDFAEHMINNGFHLHVIGGKNMWKLGEGMGGWQNPFPFERVMGLGGPGSPAVAPEELESYHDVVSLLRPSHDPSLLDRLVSSFYMTIFSHAPIIDRKIHTADNMLARCPFLALVVCTLAAKVDFLFEREVLVKMIALTDRLATTWASARYARTAETVMAYLLLALYTPKELDYDDQAQQLVQVRRAAAIAHVIGLPHLSEEYPPKHLPEIAPLQDVLSAQRTWIFLFCLDHSTSYRLGVPPVTQEDFVIEQACNRTWSLDEKYKDMRNPEDTAVAAYMHLQKIVAEAIYNLRSSTTYAALRMQMKLASDELNRWEDLCPFFLFPVSPGTVEYLLVQFLKLFVASARLYIVQCSWQVARSNIKFHSELPAVTEGLRKAAMLVCKLMVRIAQIEIPIPGTPVILRSLHTTTFDSAHWDCYQAANILAALCSQETLLDTETKLKVVAAVTYTADVLDKTSVSQHSASTHVAKKLHAFVYGEAKGSLIM